MRTPSIKPDPDGLDEIYDAPSAEELNRSAYGAGCGLAIGAVVLLALAVTGVLWWVGVL